MAGAMEFMNAMADRWAEMMWPAVWQSALVAVLVLVVTATLRKGPSSLRFWLWMLVPLRLLVMPVITVPLPVLPPTEPAFVAEPVEMSALPLSVPAGWAPPMSELPPTPTVANHTEEIAITAVRPSVSAWLMAGWLAGVAVLGLRTCRAGLRLRRVVKSASETTDAEVLMQARKAASMVGLRRMPRILVTGEQTSPFACGVGRPVVVLPASFLEGVGRGGLLAVLAHECAHLRRHDSLLGLVLAVCEAFYFFHPAVFLAKRRILLERERACDDWVLAATASKRSAYAGALLRAAGAAPHVGRPVGPAVIVTESFSDLKVRLTAIASGKTPTARLSRKMVVLVVALGLLSVPGIALTAREPIDLAVMAAPVDVTADRENEAADHGRVEDAAITVAVAPEPVATAPPSPDAETRTIRFLSSRSLGGLFVQRKVKQRHYRLGPDYDGVSEWDYLAEARGKVAVPAGKRVKLEVALTALSDLSGLSSLGPNDLYGLSIGDYSGSVVYPDASIMPHLRGLTGLKQLNLAVNVSDNGLRHLSGLTELEELRLKSESFRDAGLAHLEGLESLEVLRLTGGTVTDDGLKHLAKLSSLRELCLDVSNIRGRGFSHLAKLRSLEFLFLAGGNTFGDRGLRYVAEIASLKSLTLFGGELKISDAGMVYLARMTGLEELRFVWIQGITDAGIAKLTPLRSLKLLDLHSTSITDDGLAHVASMYALEDLTLPASGVTDRGLAQVSKLDKLKRLNARGMTPVHPTDPGPFTDVGLSHVSRLPDLEEFHICSGGGITDAGMAYLARLEGLKQLNLMCNGITNDGLATLATIQSLRHFWLSCPNSGAISVSGANHLNALTGLEFLSMLEIVRDESTLDLSGLTNLENLTITIDERGVRRPRGALRDADLAWLADHRRLKWVQVGGGAEFGDEGMAHLAGLNGLQRLTLGGDLVTDQGLSYLAGKHDLTLLYVEGNITDDGLRHLEGLKNLTNLSVKSPHGFSTTAEARLRNALPNVSFFQLNETASEGYGAASR